MYDRFTDQARKVMQLANGEAQRFNHDDVATEHLLLGLIKLPKSIALNVLKSFNVDVIAVCDDVEQKIQARDKGHQSDERPSGTGVKKVLENALQEAKNLNHNYVGTEHLLLGLLGNEHTTASEVLKRRGVSLEAARAEVQRLLSGGQTVIPEDTPDERLKEYLRILLNGLQQSINRFGLDETQKRQVPRVLKILVDEMFGDQSRENQ